MVNESEIKDFFGGREECYKLFRHLRSAIEKICSSTIEVSKTQISFGERYKYLWVWLPQKWTAKRPETSLTLTIVTGEKLDSPRIVESVEPKKGFWTHHIVLYNKSDIDQEIDTLIRASYEFYRKRKLEKELKQKK